MNSKLLTAISVTIKPIKPAITSQQDKDPTVSFGNLFSSIVGVLLAVASIWAFIELLMAGILWISAGGDKGRVENAQQRILNAVIGLVIVAASWAVYLLILNWLGINQGGSGLQFKLPTLWGQ